MQNFTKLLKIHFHKVLQKMTKWYRTSQKCTSLHKTVSKFNKIQHLTCLQNCTHLYKTLPNYTTLFFQKLFHNCTKYTEICKSFTNTIQNFTKTLQDFPELYKTLINNIQHTSNRKNFTNSTRLYEALQSYTKHVTTLPKLHKAMHNFTKPYKNFTTLQSHITCCTILEIFINFFFY